MDDAKKSAQHDAAPNRAPEAHGAAPTGGGAHGGLRDGSHQAHPPIDLRTAHLWHLQPVRDVLVIAIVVLTIYAGYALRTVTVPLLVALALAYLVEPVVARMTRWRRMSRPLAVGAILAGLGALLAVTVAIVAPVAVGQTLSFAENLRNHRYDGAIERVLEVVPADYRNDAQQWINRMIYSTPEQAAIAARADAEPAQDAPDAKDAPSTGDGAQPQAAPEAGPAEAAEPAAPRAGIPEAIRGVDIGSPMLSLLGSGSRQVYEFMLGVLQLSLVLFLIPFYFFYFSVHWPSITGFFAKLVPDDRKGTVFDIVSEMDRAVAGFVRGRIVICLLMGIMFAIGWQICGVPYAIALGILTGLLSIVPYLGGIGVPLAVGLLVVDQFGMPADARMAVWGMLVWPTAVFVIVQTIEGYLLTPVIAGKATNLDPVTIVVAILAGGSVAGVYGMLLAIPAAACGKIAIKRVVLPRLIEFARGRVSDPLPIEGGLEEDATP